MIHCGILEDNDAAMARFRGGLNSEIQDILDYKEYYDMTCWGPSASEGPQKHDLTMFSGV